jgi:hypothetical protein
MDAYAQALHDAAVAALPGWVQRCVRSRASGLEVEAAEAGRRAAREVGERLRVLLAADIDEQRTNPLSVLRGAVVYPTEVLKAAGVTPVPRDAFVERAFPDDIYNLSPASWREIDETLQEPGLIWGAWKAKQFLERRRAEGKLP